MKDYWQLALNDIHAGKLIKDIRKNIQRHTLMYLQQYGRIDWISAWQLGEKLGDYGMFNFKEPKVLKYFFLIGSQNKIRASTSDLRKLGYPIIAGMGKKGYRYADENCPDVAEAWEDRLRLFEERKKGLDKEEETDVKLLDRIIEKMPEGEKKKRLIEVRNQYRKGDGNKI